MKDIASNRIQSRLTDMVLHQDAIAHATMIIAQHVQHSVLLLFLHTLKMLLYIRSVAQQV
jgi:hypothetical protein